MIEHTYQIKKTPKKCSTVHDFSTHELHVVFYDWLFVYSTWDYHKLYNRLRFNLRSTKVPWYYFLDCVDHLESSTDRWKRIRNLYELKELRNICISLSIYIYHWVYHWVYIYSIYIVRAFLHLYFYMHVLPFYFYLCSRTIAAHQLMSFLDCNRLKIKLILLYYCIVLYCIDVRPWSSQNIPDLWTLINIVSEDG